LLDIREDLDEFLESLDELIKFIENLGLREIESLSFGHISNLFLGSLVSFFVFSVEFDAASKNLYNLSWIFLPNLLILVVRNNLFLAILYHLVCNLDEQSSHLVRSIIETSDSMDHLYGIHQRRKGLNDLLRSSSV